ncbi:MAG: 50S ribosomal protein L11 methyltransferase [Anaerolineae bacterium]|nr:50S ribosomal protein L11 methyltransferase [Anaerolineae bacterium]
MNWIEVSLAVAAEAAEAVAEVLSRYAPNGVAIDLGAGDTAETVTVRAYLVADETIAIRQRQVEEALWHLNHIWPMPAPEFRPVQEQDWTAIWKEHLPVLHLGNRVVIKPTWRAYAPQPGEIILEMDPGQAFGTGLHPTTQLCLDALLRIPLQAGGRILDLGTGTGILALVAAKIAPVHIHALDIDAHAVATARQNTRANHVSHTIRVEEGSLAAATGVYDLIMANILAPVIIDMAQQGLAERLAPEGKLIVSGILLEQRAEVVAAFEEHGLVELETFTKGDWVALLAEKKKTSSRELS